MVLQLHSVEVLDSQDGEQRLKESHLWAFRHAVEESEAVETHNSLLPAFPGPSWKCSKTHCHLNQSLAGPEGWSLAGLGEHEPAAAAGMLIPPQQEGASCVTSLAATSSALPSFQTATPSLPVFPRSLNQPCTCVAVHVPGTPLPWPSLEQLK